MPTDPILFWNAVALETHRRDFAFDIGPDGRVQLPEQGGPTRTSRALAIVHIAMYDAWNGANATGNSYLGAHAGAPALPALPPGAAADTAVAGAAATTLRALFPRQRAWIDAQVALFCAQLPSGVTNAQRNDGMGFGNAVGMLLLDFRSGDGADDATPYQPGHLPGQHREDPYNPGQGFLGPRWGEVAPFCIPPFPAGGNTAGYLPPPPPLNDPLYRAHFIEARDRGARARGARTATQEMTGLYWAYDGPKGLGTPPRMYNQIVRQIATDQGNTTAQNARLFALVNVGMADAGIVAWRAKYEHNLWRPAVGVREDDLGTGPTGLGTGNAAGGDPAWRAFGAPRSNEPGRGHFTPPFPAYPSGHASFGTAVFELVARFYGVAKTALSFSFVSDELNGQTLDDDGSARTCVRRTYTLQGAIDDNIASRVWLGVHWRFDGEGGRQLGETVATQVFGAGFP
jgi:hypothetical protein